MRRKNDQAIISFGDDHRFCGLHSVLQKDFAEVPQRLQDGSMVNLNSDRLDQRIKYLLEKEFYFEDPRDIQLAYSVVAQGMGAVDGGMDNIGELNKQRFSISTQDALDKGGISFKKKSHTRPDADWFFR